MNAINIREIKQDDLILFYSAEELKWLRCQITQKGLNFVHVKALEGNIEGFFWTENLKHLQDPDHYRVFIPPTPKPPKKRSKLVRLLSKWMIRILQRWM